MARGDRVPPPLGLVAVGKDAAARARGDADKRMQAVVDARRQHRVLCPGVEVAERSGRVFGDGQLREFGRQLCYLFGWYCRQRREQHLELLDGHGEALARLVAGGLGISNIFVYVHVVDRHAAKGVGQGVWRERLATPWGADAVADPGVEPEMERLAHNLAHKESSVLHVQAKGIPFAVLERVRIDRKGPRRLGKIFLVYFH